MKCGQAMVVIHKSWCGACKRLGPVVASSAAIQKHAGDFVMINVLVRLASSFSPESIVGTATQHFQSEISTTLNADDAD